MLKHYLSKPFWGLVLCFIFCLSCGIDLEEQSIILEETKEMILNHDWYVVEIFCEDEYYDWENDSIPFFDFNQAILNDIHQLGSSLEFEIENGWLSNGINSSHSEYLMYLHKVVGSGTYTYRVLDFQPNKLVLMGRKEFPDDLKEYCWIILEPR